jgi:hypothetical protein
MNILTELTAVMTALGVPVETGVFSGEAPDTYAVLTPLTDSFDLHADNRPGIDVQEARVSLFSKRSFLAVKDQIVAAALDSDMVITNRSFISHDDETAYFHYVVDVTKHYIYTEG